MSKQWVKMDPKARTIKLMIFVRMDSNIWK